jgi:hypothetical protein
MLLPKLREEVLEANLELVRRGLVLYTFGNASGISREDSLLVIKPSGVPYETMIICGATIAPSPKPPNPSFCGGAALLRRISASCKH